MKFSVNLSNFENGNEVIEALSLKTRAENVLKRNKIFTIGQLCDRWDDLFGLEGCGVNVLREIRSALFNENIARMSDKQLKKFAISFSKLN